MTIQELIERLEEHRDVLGEDAEVRLMTQQNWPFESSIAGLASSEDINNAGEDDDEDLADAEVLFIVEGRQLAYGSRRAWDVVN